MTLWFLGRRSHSFNTGHVDQILQVPPSVQHLLSGGPLAHFVRGRVRGSLDRSTIVETDTEGRGFPPYDPTLMIRPAAIGVRSRARQRPDLRTISDSWTRQLTALGGLFMQVLTRCRAAGLVPWG